MYTPDDKEISQGPRDYLGLGKSLRRQGWISQHLPSTDILSSSIIRQGVDQEIPPVYREGLTLLNTILPLK